MKRVKINVKIYLIVFFIIGCIFFFASSYFVKISNVENYVMRKAYDENLYIFGSYAPKAYLNKIEIIELDKTSDFILYECIYEYSSLYLTSIVMYDFSKSEYIDVKKFKPDIECLKIFQEANSKGDSIVNYETSFIDIPNFNRYINLQRNILNKRDVIEFYTKIISDSMEYQIINDSLDVIQLYERNSERDTLFSETISKEYVFTYNRYLQNELDSTGDEINIMCWYKHKGIIKFSFYFIPNSYCLKKVESAVVGGIGVETIVL